MYELMMFGSTVWATGTGTASWPVFLDQERSASTNGILPRGTFASTTDGQRDESVVELGNLSFDGQ